MKQNNKILFTVLTVIAWIIFVGLCVEAGALLTNFVYTFFKPEAIHNLYQKLDLSAMYNNNPWDFYRVFSYIIFIAVIKAYLFYLVVMMVHKINLKKPFTYEVANQIKQISLFTFVIGLLSYMGKTWTAKQFETTAVINELAPFWVDSKAFVLMGAVIYIIAVIFKSGVEMQSENDLTA